MTIKFWSNFCLMLFPQAAYSFYNVSTATPWVDLMGDALVIISILRKSWCHFFIFFANSIIPFKVLAKKENFDVFNALDLMENR